MLEEIAIEHIQEVHEGSVVRLVTLFCTSNIVVVYKIVIVHILVRILLWRWWYHSLQDTIIMILKALGNTGKEKYRQDRGMLLIN